MTESPAKGAPLAGVRVLEVGGIGPAPFAGMLLAELGADVVRVDRPGERSVLPIAPEDDLLNRGKRSLELDLKLPAGRDALLALAERAAILVEGFRPGVAERLGIGPEDCRARNPALVYGRMTGWGQDGPRAQEVGHDINYLALTGALHTIGPDDGPPQIPVNYVGDFGGGSLYLVVGLLGALRDAEAGRGGRVVDAAIVDGVAHLMASVHLLRNAGAWADRRASNLIDGGAPFYAVYATADGRYIAVGAIERRFYTALLEGLEVDVDPERQDDRSTWAETRALFATRFASRTRAQWTECFAALPACVAPVNSIEEALEDPHISARGTLLGDHGRLRAAPAPRFEPPVQTTERPAPVPGADRDAVWAQWGVAGP